MENEVQENEVQEVSSMILSGASQLSTGLFGRESKESRMTSVDLNDEDAVDMLINSMQDVDYKLNDCIDKEIIYTACYVIERDVDSFNDETGESITRKKHVLMLFDDKGKSYVTGSNACYMSFVNICSIKGLPTKEHPLKLKAIKVDAKEKGHSYLKLKICK